MTYDLITFPGGATRGVAMLAAAQELQERAIEADVYAGSSAGSIVAFFAAMGGNILHRICADAGQLKPADIFRYSPFRKSGRISYTKSIWNLLARGHMAEVDLEPLITRYVTERLWHDYIQDADSPSIMVLTTEVKAGTATVWDLKHCRSLRAVAKVLNASASYPPLGRQVDGNIDGGFNHHSPGPLLLSMGKHARSLHFLLGKKIDTPETDRFWPNLLRAGELIFEHNARSDLWFLTHKESQAETIVLEDMPPMYTFDPATLSMSQELAREAVEKHFDLARPYRPN